MNKYIELIRPRHLVGCGFIFLIGTALFWKVNDYVGNVALGLIAFLITYSAVYVYNDLLDIKEDKKHYVKWKANRPLPSGQISKSTAKKLIIASIFIGLSLSLFVSTTTFIVNSSILLINLFYTKFRLKKKPLIGITIICLIQALKILNGWLINNSSITGLPWPFLTFYGFSYGLLMGVYKKKHFKNEKRRKGYMLFIGLITLGSMFSSAILYPFTQFIFLKVIIGIAILLSLVWRLLYNVDKNFLNGLKINLLVNLTLVLMILWP